MVWTMVAFTLGAALIIALSLIPVIAAIQWFTKYPFRRSGQEYPLGKQMPNGDPRLETESPTFVLRTPSPWRGSRRAISGLRAPHTLPKRCMQRPMRPFTLDLG